MRRIAIVAILAGAAAAAAVAGFSTGSTGSATVAVVDGTAVSRESYDEYASVFTAPDGSLGVSEKDVLLSLVNQVLVRREADRRGIVVADQDVSGAIADMEHLEHVETGLSLPGIDNDEAFHERVRMFLLFKLVRAEVVGRIDTPYAMLEEEYLRDPSLHSVSLAEAIPVLGERLIRRESDRRWATWLGDQRACADIRIVDPSFDVPSSTPRPGCGAETDG